MTNHFFHVLTATVIPAASRAGVQPPAALGIEGKIRVACVGAGITFDHSTPGDHHP
jgi:hypothetical protein